MLNILREDADPVLRASAWTLFLDKSCAQVMRLGKQQRQTSSAGPEQHERYMPSPCANF